ncbi:DUF2849 domain-containing protein [Qipengyuania sp. 6B39]|uniref:DUF2849 domain-containing protein n=1 Tax=Qipengyuania proteolytica TaxID=2867239 RepID=UPI001C8AA299|nr:DUF2849 domain-containing protein [Qipengyuania proteolytica]MBX7496613.1 DUF2849 domain-containing protein [Qipengyuania proteolytica]
MRLLTGNDLKTGAVTWWTGTDWSIHVEDAADVTGHEDEIARREEASRRVNGPYAVDAELKDGVPRPSHIKERVRSLGPTVRPDLTLKPAEPDIGNWVI